MMLFDYWMVKGRSCVFSLQVTLKLSLPASKDFVSKERGSEESYCRRDDRTGSACGTLIPESYRCRATISCTDFGSRTTAIIPPEIS